MASGSSDPRSLPVSLGSLPPVLLCRMLLCFLCGPALLAFATYRIVHQVAFSVRLPSPRVRFQGRPHLELPSFLCPSCTLCLRDLLIPSMLEDIWGVPDKPRVQVSRGRVSVSLGCSEGRIAAQSWLPALPAASLAAAGATLLCDQLLPAARGLSPSAQTSRLCPESRPEPFQGLTWFSQPALPSHTGCLFLPSKASPPCVCSLSAWSALPSSRRLRSPARALLPAHQGPNLPRLVRLQKVPTAPKSLSGSSPSVWEVLPLLLILVSSRLPSPGRVSVSRPLAAGPLSLDDCVARGTDERMSHTSPRVSSSRVCWSPDWILKLYSLLPSKIVTSSLISISLAV